MPGEPREFGPYRLIRRLGVGGMAETFEATRRGASGFEQRVCLKRVLPAFGEDEDLVSRFQREARLAAKLRHTNIVGVIDVGEVDGAQYMALELVDGVDLRSLLRSSPEQRLSPEVVVLLALDLAYALEHAHDTLVHRDISPSNVLLDRSGEAKLADFGVAKSLDNAKVTASRNARGKIPYMAPEQMRGESVDGRADLFSLGVVMFEALAGARPFDGAHDVETMQRILDGRRRTLEELAPATPLALQEIVERLIASDRAQRFQSASELLEALADLVPPPNVRRALSAAIEGYRGGPGARLHVRAREEERDTELTQVPGFDAAPRTERRSRWKVPLAVLAAALLFGAVALTVGPGFGSIPEPGLAPERAPELERAPEAEIAPEAQLAPDAEAAPELANDPELEDEVESEVDTGRASASAASGKAPTLARRPSKGWVRVVVQPWGNVWIDGDYMGRAPVLARLPRGRHTIAAGRELPARKRVVRIQPGARKEIVLTLEEP
jgi:serine/threonine-protein kinase